MRRIGLVGLLCMGALFASPGSPPKHSLELQHAPDLVLYVDAGNPEASDSNPGTPALPLKTINGATRIALNENGPHTAVIRIASGTYREAISSFAAPPGIAITYQAAQVGTVIVSGSDVWTGWERHGDVYVHAWPYRWGLAPVPAGWPPLSDIVRRREMILVNGALLTQVLSRDEMTVGAFFIDETGQQAYLWPPAGIDMAQATVEVAVRPQLFNATASDLTIRGLVFKHAATFLDGDAVSVSGTNLRIEDAQFLWNNWGGLRIADSTDATVRDSTANYNGGRGMTTFKDKDVLLEGNDTSYNAWRGAWGDFYGWSQGGIKNLRLHGATFLRHKSLHNKTYGFWLDFDNENVTIENATSCGNLLAGFFVEASQGPVTISHSAVCANKEDGLVVHASAQVRVMNSVFYGNGLRHQLKVSPYEQLVDNWETGKVLTVRPQHMVLCGNAIVGTDQTQFLLVVPNLDSFLRTLRSSRNDFWNPLLKKSVWMSGPDDGGAAYDLPGWQQVSKGDLDSVWADPRFTNPDTWNFIPLPESRWTQC